MKTNNAKVQQHFLFLLLAFAIALPLTGCAGEKKQRSSRSDPASDTMTEESSKDVVVLQGNQANNSAAPAAAATNSNPFEGTWDVNSSGSFFNWTFGYATKKDQKLEGKITDASSSVVGDYVVFPNKTIELNVYAASLNAIVAYKVSNGGNQIDIDDGPTKVTMTKGKTNTTAQNDGNVLASHIWTNVTNPGEQLEFLGVRKSSAGWNGAVNVFSGGGSGNGTFSLTPGKLTITVSGSVDSYKYKLRNSNTLLDLTDSSGNTETYQ
ncbi:MAG: hypothetical protein IPI64_05935 [Chloracidobacterium sp.]|nr:hypothetical protein [Chloracidobacterium sp.]MBK8303510.1 hypothetical protein [Chloracidobacterium sp.]